MFSYFGSEGAYEQTDAQAQKAVQAQNMFNVYSSTGTASNTVGIIGCTLGYGGYSHLANQTVHIQNVQPAPAETLKEYIEKVSKPAKKAARGVLSKLREEIDGWHGDILERCPV